MKNIYFLLVILLAMIWQIKGMFEVLVWERHKQEESTFELDFWAFKGY